MQLQFQWMEMYISWMLTVSCQVVIPANPFVSPHKQKHKQKNHNRIDLFKNTFSETLSVEQCFVKLRESLENLE